MVIALLLSKVLDSHLQLIKRVLQSEKIVQIEWEVNKLIVFRDFLVAFVFNILHGK